MNEAKALKFSWDEISQKLQPEIEAILGRKLRCVAKPDDEYYWCVGFPEGRIPLSELYKILEAINASERERIDSVPPESDHPVDVSCLGMSASELLLRRCLGYQWETIHIEDDALWVLGEKDGDQDEAYIDWVIHGCANGVVCEIDGKTENGFMPGTCNFHTHGMERYNHKDFQMTLGYPHKEICRILNTLGLRVQAGERFKNGEMVSGIYEDCDVRLTEFEETGRTVLRVIIPDKHNRFPEDPGCDVRYTPQIFTTDFIYREGGWKI